MLLVTSKSQDGKLFKSNSLSGGERNRVFLQRDGNFKEYTLVSGADFREDGRGFALFDYDRDGFLDIAVTSPNKPRFRIMRNTIGDQLGKQNSDHGFVEISLVGGQESAEPSTEWSPRDAFGSTVLVTVGEEKRMFHLSLGEGLSGQNAKRIHVGMGAAEKIDSIEVTWPSGKKTVKEDIATGERITVRERD